MLPWVLLLLLFLVCLFVCFCSCSFVGRKRELKSEMFSKTLLVANVVFNTTVLEEQLDEEMMTSSVGQPNTRSWLDKLWAPAEGNQFWLSTQQGLHAARDFFLESSPYSKVRRLLSHAPCPGVLPGEQQKQGSAWLRTEISHVWAKINTSSSKGCPQGCRHGKDN